MNEENAEEMKAIKAESGLVLIIKSTAESLAHEEVYLKNRRWEIGQALTMKEALTFIIKNRPQYVLIDVDHPNPKMKLLPNVLIQAFPIKVIVFSRNDSPTSLASLRETRHAYSLFPPISGPAIERMLLRARKERSELDARGLRFKTDPIDRSVLAELIRLQDKGGGSEVPLIVQEGPGHGKKFSQRQEGATSGSFKLGGTESLNSLTRNATQIFTSEQKKRNSLEKECLFARSADEALQSVSNPQIGRPNGEKEKIERATNVACIIVESPRFSGYLVAAMGKNRQIDEGFIETLKQRLFSYLKKNGEAPANGDAMGIRIKEVKFEDWALEQAEFLRKSLHQGHEIAMAFFPFKKAVIHFENSDDTQMVKLSLQELKEDVVVEFDLFLHMPKNDKYLLYTPRGKPLKKAQIGRLTEKGITHMHLKKEAVNAVKKYRAQNYLNEKIDSFEGQAAPRQASSR